MDVSNSWPIATPDIPVDHCYDPLNLSAQVNGNIVTLAWDSPHDNDGFNLIYKPQDLAEISMIVFGRQVQLELTPNVSYTWGVQTMCDRLTLRASAIVYGLPFVTGQPALACPIINSQGAMILKSAGATRIEWTNIPGILKYRLEVSTGNTMPLVFESTVNYITLLVLMAGTDYRWRIMPVCDGLANWSEWATFRTAVGSECPAVEINAVFDITTGVVYWTNNEGASSYQVYINGTLIAAEHPVNILTLQNLTPLTQYNIIIIPNCDKGPGPMTTLQASTQDYAVKDPTNLVTTINSQSQLAITWVPATGIDEQEIMINGTKATLAVNINYYTVPGVPNTNYSILIRSVKDGIKSSGLFGIFHMPAFCPKPIPRLLNATHQSITVGWPLLSNATGYKVRYRLFSIAEWISITLDANTSSVNLTNLFANSQYIIEVSAICGNATSLVADISIDTLQVPMCPVAVNVAVSNIGQDTATVTFEMSDESLPTDGNFELFITDGVDDVYFPFTGSPLILNSDLVKPDKNYTIAVRNNCSSNPSVSESVSFTSLKGCSYPLNIVGIMDPLTNNTEMNVTWDAAFAATAYTVEFKEAGATDWTIFGDVLTNAATITGLHASIYNLRITAHIPSRNRDCPWTGVSNPPKILDLNRLSDNPIATFYWTAIPNIDSYRLKVTSLTDDPFYETYPVTADSMLYLKPNTNYSATVYARFGNVEGPVSAAMVFTTNNEIPNPCDPDCSGPFVKAFFQDSNINDPTITATTKKDITVFLLDFNRSCSYQADLLIEGATTPIASLSIAANNSAVQPRFVFLGKPFANDYKVIVTRLCGAEACHSTVDVEDSDCDAITDMSETHTDTTIEIDFTPIDGVTGYDIFLNEVYVATIIAPPYTITGLLPSTDYRITARTICTCSNTSILSDILAVTTDAPL